MSEVGQSLHFWRSGHGELRDFLVTRGVTGRIVASNAQWTCFVPFDREDESRILGEWSGTAVRWSYAEDYGLGLDFYRDGRLLGQVSLIWGDALTGQPPGGNFSSELQSGLVRSGVLSTSGAAEVQLLLSAVTARTVSGSTVRDRMAKVLNVAAFEWLSPELCVQEDIELARQRYLDAEDIEAP
jgi:hypothetical protein